MKFILIDTKYINRIHDENIKYADRKIGIITSKDGRKLIPFDLIEDIYWNSSKLALQIVTKNIIDLDPSELDNGNEDPFFILNWYRG